MKYTLSTIIDKPIDEVVILFNNQENLYKWMEGLESIDLFEGVAGKKGAKSRMHFKYGRREMDMLETIIENDLPRKMVTTYDAKGVSNIIFTSMESIEGNKTKYNSTQEFKMHGFMKVVAFLAPKMFKKQTNKILTNFKNFAEIN